MYEALKNTNLKLVYDRFWVDLPELARCLQGWVHKDRVFCCKLNNVGMVNVHRVLILYNEVRA